MIYCFVVAEVASLLAVSETKGDSLTGLDPGNEIGLEWGMVSGEGCSEPIANGSLPALESA